MVTSEFEKLSFELVLTGSRFFGNVHDKSDWDFYSPILTLNQEKELTSLGFVRENKYADQLFGGVLEVFSHPDDVHVMIVADIEKRHRVQQIVKEFFPSGYSNKAVNAKSIWNMATRIAELESRKVS